MLITPMAAWLVATITEAPVPPVDSGLDPANIGILGTAIATIIGAYLVYKRSRDAFMEREIRKLRDYSWLKNEQSEQRLKYLEDKIDADEDYIDALQIKVLTGDGPPLPDRRKVVKTWLASATITPDASQHDLKRTIDKVVASPEGPDTGPIETA